MGERTVKVFLMATPRRLITGITWDLCNTGVRGPPLQHSKLYLQTIKRTYEVNHLDRVFPLYSSQKSRVKQLS